VTSGKIPPSAHPDIPLCPETAAELPCRIPVALAEQVQRLIEQGLLADMLLKKYPLAHAVRTDKALYDYVLESKARICATPGN